MFDILSILFIAGLAGQAIRASFGLSKSYSKDKEISSKRFIGSMAVGGLGGILVPTLIVSPLTLTAVTLTLAIMGGFFVASLSERAYQMLTDNKKKDRISAISRTLTAIALILTTSIFIMPVELPESPISVILNKQNETINVVPGTIFCVSRILAEGTHYIGALHSPDITPEGMRLVHESIEFYNESIVDTVTPYNFTYNSTCHNNITNISYPCEKTIVKYNKTYKDIERNRTIITYTDLGKKSYAPKELVALKESQQDKVEKRRKELSSKLQEFERISYTGTFTLAEDTEIEMCFRAPNWDEIQSGAKKGEGVISYMTGDDSENSTWWGTYDYRADIENETDVDLCLYVNGTNKWQGRAICTNPSKGNISIYYNSATNFTISNGTTEVGWFEEDAHRNYSIATAHNADAMAHFTFDDFHSNATFHDTLEGNDFIILDGVRNCTESVFGNCALTIYNAVGDYGVDFKTFASEDVKAVCWFNRQNTATSGTAMGAMMGNGAYTMYTYVGKADPYSIMWYDGTVYDSGYDVAANTWELICVNNINWGAGTYDIWLNAVKINSSTMRSVNTYDNKFNFYQSAYSAGDIFLKDDLRFYNDTLSTAEMSALYNNSLDLNMQIGAEESAAVNTAPTIADANISPTTGYTDTLFYGNVTGIENDTGDTLTGYCQIWNGYVKFGSVWNSTILNNTMKNICNITPSNTTVGETWKFEMWVGDGTVNSSKLNSTSVTILDSPMVFTNISVSPANVTENSTGRWIFKANVTDADGVNGSKCILRRTVYCSICEDYYWSLRLPSNDKAQSVAQYSEFGNIFRADNRNESAWFELDNFTDGNIYKWAINDNTSDRMEVTDISSTLINITHNGSVHNSVFPNIWWLDRVCQEACGARTEHQIYKDHPFIIKKTIVNISHNFTEHSLVGLNYTGNPNKNLDNYRCNSSYDTYDSVSHMDSPYCTYVLSLTEAEVRDYAMVSRNSSYTSTQVFWDEGTASGLSMTPTYYEVWSSQTNAINSYTIDILHCTTSTNSTFNETNVAWTSTDNGVTWIQVNGTPDTGTFPIGSGHQIQWDLTCFDDNDKNYTSTMWTDDIGKVFYYPSRTVVEFIYSEYGSEDFDLNGTHSNILDIRFLVGSDPDGGIITVNATLVNASDLSYIATINLSFGQDNLDVNITFNSTSVADGEYKILTVVVDDEGKITNYTTEDNFTILNMVDTAYEFTGCSGMSLLRFTNCSPDWTHYPSEPQGQTDSCPLLNITNNGTLIGNINSRVAGALNNGWYIYIGNQSGVTNAVNISTTDWQRIYTGLNFNVSQEVWLYAKCAEVTSAPGQNIDINITAN